jgi:L-glyceraldehyde 3-phosphate reductase
MTSAVLGASRPEQLQNSAGALENTNFSAEELAAINAAGEDPAINIWKGRRPGG